MDSSNDGVNAVADPEAAIEPAFKRMKLRYAGSCRSCGTQLNSGTLAVYDRIGKNVCCLSCFDSSGPVVEPAVPVGSPIARPPEPEHPGQLTAEETTERLSPNPPTSLGAWVE